MILLCGKTSNRLRSLMVQNNVQKFWLLTKLLQAVLFFLSVFLPAILKFYALLAIIWNYKCDMLKLLRLLKIAWGQLFEGHLSILNSGLAKNNSMEHVVTESNSHALVLMVDNDCFI